MNPDIKQLHAYPFEKLSKLLVKHRPPAELAPIALSIGEPKHRPPAFALTFMADHLQDFARYPTTKGLPELRIAIASWLTARYGLSSIDPDHEILPVNGTREAIFSFTQAVVDRTVIDRTVSNKTVVSKTVSNKTVFSKTVRNKAKQPIVISPNPFYQIYEGAAILAGASLFFVPCLDSLDGLPDFTKVPETVWQQCQLLFICSPGNPTGKVIPASTLELLIQLADEHDFVIASDECYAEIYQDEQQPPIGLLQVCAKQGRHDYKQCIVFHSLSKRSNMPGLRSGFVAGDQKLISCFLKYRTYHGCAMPIPTQLTSVALWKDEAHVLANRDLYRKKFQAVVKILAPVWPIKAPEAAFYLWPKTPIADDKFAVKAFSEQHITLLPGRFLGRGNSSSPNNDLTETRISTNGSANPGASNPGENHVRMALVATVEECIEAAERLKNLVVSL